MKEVEFRCETEGCDTKKTRKVTEKETAQYKIIDEFLMNDTHEVWWEFLKEFQHTELRGYDLMEAMKKWAEKYPERVTSFCVDDNAHATSLVLLVHHGKPGGNHYMGASLIYVPQLSTLSGIYHHEGDGVQPAYSTFFMYPSHAAQAIDKLTEVRDNKLWPDGDSPSMFDVFNGTLHKTFYDPIRKKLAEAGSKKEKG